MSLNSTTAPQDIVTATSRYGYVPTLWICITFVALFGLTSIIHLGQAFVFKPRLYWLIPTTVMCGIGEVIGWCGRLWSSKNPENGNAFLMQISTTIISPVFLTAALYTILGIIIRRLGPQYSRLEPKTYLKIFVSADVFALIVQAVGGALASIATTLSGANTGSQIMVAGIFLQMFAMLCYTFLAAEFLIRLYLKRPLRIESPSSSPRSSPVHKEWMPGDDAMLIGGFLPARLGLMVIGLALATILVFIRTVYRSVELLGGWHGPIIRTQIFFNLLDATPIVLALFTLNFLSPAFLLRTQEDQPRGVVLDY
ncbi:RTA1 like protein [Ramaria rubella]|nr:RTA1 like protein [Ramaria rubella]